VYNLKAFVLTVLHSVDLLTERYVVQIGSLQLNKLCTLTVSVSRTTVTCMERRKNLWKEVTTNCT